MQCASMHVQSSMPLLLCWESRDLDDGPHIRRVASHKTVVLDTDLDALRLDLKDDYWKT